jgi:hypothetical protein
LCLASQSPRLDWANVTRPHWRMRRLFCSLSSRFVDPFTLRDGHIHRPGPLPYPILRIAVPLLQPAAADWQQRPVRGPLAVLCTFRVDAPSMGSASSHAGIFVALRNPPQPEPKRPLHPPTGERGDSTDRAMPAIMSRIVTARGQSPSHAEHSFRSTRERGRNVC